MKEKISCSLDGKCVDFMDHLLGAYPFLGSRSAIIEAALYDIMYSYIEAHRLQDSQHGDPTFKDYVDRYISYLYDWRCKQNAKTESEN